MEILSSTKAVNTIVAIAYFCLCVVNDVLNTEWHDARELPNRKPKKAGNISVAMDAIAWVAFIAFVAMDNWQIIIGSLAGNWYGSYLGVKRQMRKDENEAIRAKELRSEEV